MSKTKVELTLQNERKKEKDLHEWKRKKKKIKSLRKK
jgi:hypothetical protein